MMTTSRSPVVLVHGLKDSAKKMARLARYLDSEGWRTHSCDLVPSWGQVGLEVLARQLRAFVADRLPADEPFNLVGFSMGGLVGRYYLQRLDGLARVRRFVTIATPHRGSLLAYAFGNPGFRQMRPESEFLKDLDRDVDRLAAAGFTCLWTPLDLVVLPANSSVVPTARCRKIWCIGHPFMVWQRHCHRAVAQALEETF
jgi:triacylglycerol lipase